MPILMPPIWVVYGVTLSTYESPKSCRRGSAGRRCPWGSERCSGWPGSGARSPSRSGRPGCRPAAATAPPHPDSSPVRHRVASRSGCHPRTFARWRSVVTEPRLVPTICDCSLSSSEQRLDLDGGAAAQQRMAYGSESGNWCWAIRRSARVSSCPPRNGARWQGRGVSPLSYLDVLRLAGATYVVATTE